MQKIAAKFQVFFFLWHQCLLRHFNVSWCQNQKCHKSYIGGWVLMDAGLNRGTPLLGSGWGCDRGNGTDKHPRDDRPTDCRHGRRKIFPATFPASSFVAFLGYFQQVLMKDGDNVRKMVILAERWWCWGLGGWA